MRRFWYEEVLIWGGSGMRRIWYEEVLVWGKFGLRHSNSAKSEVFISNWKNSKNDFVLNWLWNEKKEGSEMRISTRLEIGLIFSLLRSAFQHNARVIQICTATIIICPEQKKKFKHEAKERHTMGWRNFWRRILSFFLFIIVIKLFRFIAIYGG